MNSSDTKVSMNPVVVTEHYEPAHASFSVICQFPTRMDYRHLVRKGELDITAYYQLSFEQRMG
jgi:hypothetical protein